MGSVQTCVSDVGTSFGVGRRRRLGPDHRGRRPDVAGQVDDHPDGDDDDRDHCGDDPVDPLAAGGLMVTARAYATPLADAANRERPAQRGAGRRRRAGAFGPRRRSGGRPAPGAPTGAAPAGGCSVAVTRPGRHRRSSRRDRSFHALDGRGRPIRSAADSSDRRGSGAVPAAARRASRARSTAAFSDCRPSDCAQCPSSPAALRRLPPVSPRSSTVFGAQPGAHPLRGRQPAGDPVRDVQVLVEVLGRSSRSPPDRRSPDRAIR